MKCYDKLVRDNIPKIIRDSGNKCEIEVVNDNAVLEYLYRKLNEEVCELFIDRNIDEIVDVMEVLFAIGAKYGYSEKDILDIRRLKKNSHGGFNDNIVLKKTYRLPKKFKGRDIHTNAIPSVCYLKNMLRKLVSIEGDASKLSSWEKICYDAYQLDDIKIELLTSNESDWKDIIKNHIVCNMPSYFGASCIDIYLVAYIAESFGEGKDIFFKYIFNTNITQESSLAEAIWMVGKNDGEFLGILNPDGTVKDWDFINEWIS
ncbi:MAG: hypothetical protein ACRC92_10055 [Peptostreptococcaceae bacterium]